jgi:ankyrin repeat protein
MSNNLILRFGAFASVIILITASCSQEPGTGLRGMSNAEQKPDAVQEQKSNPEAGGDLSEVSTALSIADSLREAERHFREEYDGSPLHKAIIAKDIDLVRRLAKNGDVNKQDEYGARPLDWAIQNPKARELVPILLDAGADPALQGQDGMTALHWAATYNQVEVLPLLLRDVSDIDIKDDHGFTPLKYAQTLGNREIAALLEEKERELEGTR